MAGSEITREKLFQYKIKGQAKPFVDQNLQIQIPGNESQANLKSPNPIFSHYSSAQTGVNALPINEEEFEKAMAEARQSYEAWKRMGSKLKAKGEERTAELDSIKAIQ